MMDEGEFQTIPTRGKTDSEKVITVENKLTKLTSEAKSGEFGPANSPHIAVPDYPTAPCFACGCPDYRLTDDNRWLCKTCHPEPRGKQ